MRLMRLMKLMSEVMSLMSLIIALLTQLTKIKLINNQSITNSFFSKPTQIPSFSITTPPPQMKNPSQLLPLQFGHATSIRRLSWQDFKGKPDDTMIWNAHIYWHIDYNIIDQEKKRVSAKLYITKKSWVRPQRKCAHLLNHQQGHYLIGALCVLQFLRRVDKKKLTSTKKFSDLLSETFDRTMKEHLQLQKRYDNETEHRLNYKKQQEWDGFIYDRLEYYSKVYDRKKHRFVKLSESPEKNGNRGEKVKGG